MENPVMDHCSHSFERDAIVDWVRQHSYCPISRKPLSEEDLVPNHNLADRIEKWKWQNDLSSEEHFPTMDTATATSSNASSEMDGIQRSDVEMGRISSRRLLRKEYQAVHQSLVLLPQERRAMELAQSQVMLDQAMESKHKCWMGVKAFSTLSVIAVAIVTILWFIQDLRNGK